MQRDAAVSLLPNERAPGLSRSTALTVFLVGVALSGAAFHFIGRQIAQDARLKFERECDEIQQALERRLNSYADLLLGLRGLYRAASVISRSEFRDYVASLDLPVRYPAVTVM